MMNLMRLIFRCARMLLRRMCALIATPTQMVRLGVLLTISVFLTWITIVRQTSPVCGSRYVSSDRIDMDGHPGVRQPKVTTQSTDVTFYQINDTEIYVYSAFYDNRYRTKYIRIFGMQSRHLPANIRCQLTLADGTKVLLPWETAYPVYEQWPSYELLYHAYYYGCEVPETYRITDNVTLSLTTEGGNIETVVPLYFTRGQAKGADVYTTARDRRPRHIVVCVKALWGRVDARRLVEWLEFHRLLSVDKIVIYDTTVSGPARRVLDYYRRTGYVDLIRFDYALRMATLMQKDPFRSQLADEMMMLEQTYLVSMNDCYYRYKDSADYILVIDQDEVIVPTSESTLSQMILEAETRRLNASAFLFQTAWHLEEFGVGDETAPPYLHMQKYVKRSPVMKSQPKAMISVDGAIVINWHGSVTMPTSHGFQGNQYLPWKRYGYVHHFRKQCKYNEAKCEVLAQMIELDDVIPKYAKAVADRVRKSFSRMNMTHFLR